MQTIDFIFSIAILMMSVMIHEISHGYTAYLLGDSTAKHAGRLTLNPLKHLDFFGSFLLPLMTFYLGGFIFGWAKPVPYNPYNLKNQKWGPAMVGIAGPLSNITVAVVFGLLIRFGTHLLPLSPAFWDIASFVVFINLLLAVFNMVPIPPLDGSKLLFSALPYRLRNIEYVLERYGFFFLLIFIFFFWRLLLPIVEKLFTLIAGAGF